jgi:hypothetical protein
MLYDLLAIEPSYKAFIIIAMACLLNAVIDGINK